MAGGLILLDTSILIEYYRKKDKSKSSLFLLSQSYPAFAVSAVTHFEIYAGATIDQLSFWNSFFNDIIILPFTSEISVSAVNIDSELKRKSKQIAIPDLFISATARHHNLAIATLNRKHFERIDNLVVLI
ncbi:MAG: type II toxin-antitoxin system VapC family toxin [Mucilaginibacter sp.]